MKSQLQKRTNIQATIICGQEKFKSIRLYYFIHETIFIYFYIQLFINILYTSHAYVLQWF